MTKTLVKGIATVVATILVLPLAFIAVFGRSHQGFLFGAHALALGPGIVGSYLRVAYYALTLDAFGRDGHIAIGSYFAHAQASAGSQVGIGAYCVLGQVDIGDRTQIASHVQSLSGRNQHTRDAHGRLTDEGRSFRRLKIGADCWVGAGAIVMADLGTSVTVAAGSVVVKDVPDGAVVAGNPSRVLRQFSDTSADVG